MRARIAEYELIGNNAYELLQLVVLVVKDLLTRIGTGWWCHHHYLCHHNYITYYNCDTSPPISVIYALPAYARIEPSRKDRTF